MAKPTVRDIVEITNGISSVAQALRDAASGAPIEGQTTHMVAAQVSGLLNSSAALDGYNTVLKKLIPEDEVSVETETAPGT